MKFLSTNGGFEVNSFSDAILTGLCPDGGLLMPEYLPKLNISLLESWKNLNYSSLLTEFLKWIVDKNDPIYEYLPDIEKETFRDFNASTIEIKQLNKFSVIELFHGPTKAFKDYPMFPLAFLIDKANKIKSKANNNIIKKQNIIIGTTGDTGSSALEASRYFTETLNVFVLFPKDRITLTQRLQMTTSNSENGYPIEFFGTCDDIDKMLWSINEDKEFNQRYNISCLNSINCGRIICQMALHIFIYLKIAENMSNIVNIAIPCGGWGNLISACLVHEMSLPIRIIVCTNENDIGDKLIKLGFIEKQTTSHHSWSSAMDTVLPYNIARLFWIFSNHNADFTKSTMTKIEKGEKVIIPPEIINKIRSVIVDSIAVSDDETLLTMSRCFNEENYYLCPHTATAATYFYKKEAVGNFNAILGTASIEKFSEAGIKAGLISKFENSSFIHKIQSKQEIFDVLDFSENPENFLKEFISLRNK